MRPSSRTTSMRSPSMGLAPAQPRKLDRAVDVAVLAPLGVEHGRLRRDLDVLGEGRNDAVVPRGLDEIATLPESSAIVESSGGDAEAGADLPELLQLERRVGDPHELAAEAAVDERRLAADVRAVALGAPGLRPGEESLRGPLQGVLGVRRMTAAGAGTMFCLRFRQLHERTPLYSRRLARRPEKGFEGRRGRWRIVGR